MRIFFTILITMFVCCHSVFAASSKTKKAEQEAQQKIAKLQQLLLNSMKNPSSADAANAGTSLNQDGASGLQPQTISAPSAGLVTASSAAVGASDHSQAKSTSTETGPKKSADDATPNTATATGSVTTTDVSAEPSKPNIYDEAFSNVVNQLLPMSPPQISKLREVFTESQLAAATPPGVPPKPTSTSLLVNLSPQATAPVIRLGAGYITSLVFVDATGQPWPISAYSIGDPSSFNIQWDRKGNTLLVQSATFYKRSNLAVMLRDLNTPIMVTMISGQDAIDYRVDLRVPGFGPNAVYVQNGIPESANPVLLDVLNGIPPRGSKELKVRGGDCKAWLLNNKLYLRTSLTVISPGWQATMSSIDGTHAYQMQTSPVILALQNGRDKNLTLMLEGL